MRHTRLAMAAVAIGLVLTGCDGQGPTAVPTPTDGPAPLVAAVRCNASVRDRTIRCAPDSPASGANLIILGGQGTFVQLTSSNVQYVGTTFTFDVTTQNLLPSPQVMATTDGVTGTAEGVRVFFHSGPAVTSGTGSITVNADGQATYTSANQDYYEYSGAALGGDGILSSNETSGARNWSLDVPNTVNTFSFLLYVTADVLYPAGWVDVSAPDTVVEGATQTVTGTVRTATGEIVPAAPVTWGSSDPTVMTVDAGGQVTAVSPGRANITATSGARTGVTSFAVCPDMAVGEVYTAAMPGAAALCLAGGAAGDAEYTYMPVNLSSSAALSLTVTASGIVAVTGPPSPNRIPAGAGGLNLSLTGLQERDEVHTRMLERDRDLAMGLRGNPANLVQRASRAQRAGGARRLITPGVAVVGDLWDLNVAQGCSGALDTRVGRVVSVGTHVIIVADTMNPPGGFTTAQYDSIRLEFDSLAYPVDTANFGGPTDLDNNQRVVAFYTRAVNELSPPASSVITLGYFTARDLFSSAPLSCPRSNEGEMFYMMVPDPTGVVNSNVRTVPQVRGSTVGTMAHELQHLINGSRRTYITQQPFEEVWLNEGLSHISEELLFYRTSVGLAPRGNIVLNQLNTGPNASRRVAAFNTYANPNFGRLRGWLQRPDTAGAFKTNDALASRGAIWAFLRYAADRVNGVESSFWFDLVNNSATGVANLQIELPADPNDWMRDWVTAMYTDDSGVSVTAEYTNPSWSFRSLYTALNLSYQLVPRPLNNGVGLTLSYSRGGGTAYARFGVPTGAFASVTALSGGVPPTSPYALSVVRTK